MKRYLITCMVVMFALMACQNTAKNPNPGDGDSVRLSLTADKLISNSTINLSVTVEGEIDKLELLVNNKPEAILEAPYSYVFKAAAEAQYSVFVQAKKGSQTLNSNVLNLTIDRTPPTIISRTPEADSSANTTDIKVGFSEPLNSASVSSATVQLSDVRTGVLASSLSLDAELLSLSLADLPLGPTSLRLELKDLEDLAGNKLSSTWTWAVPSSSSFTSFSLLGEPSVSSDKSIKENPSRIAADDAGRIAVVWLEAQTIKVKLWSGTAWQELPPILSSKEPFRPDIALLSSGNPVLAWQNGTETDAGQGDIELVRWNGTVWESLGTVDTPGLDAAAPALAVDKTDQILVTWFEYDGSSSNVWVKTYKEGVWEVLGGALDNKLEHTAAYPAIALDYQGQAYVGWFEARSTDPADRVRYLFVKTWTGSEWQLLGQELNVNPFEAVLLFSLSVGGNGRPVVAFSEFESLENSNNIYVKRWTGTVWEQVGETLDFVKRQRAIYPTIVADGANGLSVAWWEGETAEDSDVVIENDIYFAHWNGTAWQQFGEMEASATSEGRYPDLALAGMQQFPVLTWSENTSLVYVKLAQ